MLEGKIEGALPISALIEEVDGCQIFKQNIDFEESENEYLFIFIENNVVCVSFAGIVIEVPQSKADIQLN